MVLWIQAAVGFVGLLVMVERMIFFQHARGRVADLLLGITNHVRKKAYAEALHEASRARGPAAGASDSNQPSSLAGTHLAKS